MFIWNAGYLSTNLHNVTAQTFSLPDPLRDPESVGPLGLSTPLTIIIKRKRK
jgi:hypothetical protein